MVGPTFSFETVEVRSISGPRHLISAESIREVVFGVEDGLVQNTTLVAGMAGAALSNRVIVIAASINAIAGVLSMSMGTYLSSKAEHDVAVGLDRGVVSSSPTSDALVMAVAYAVGAGVPLAPFVVGFAPTGVLLAMALVATASTLYGLGVLTARLSGRRPGRAGLEMVALASAAGLAGYVIGLVARAVFGLDV